MNNELLKEMGITPKEMEIAKQSIIDDAGSTTLGDLQKAIERSEYSIPIKHMLYFFLGIVSTVTSMMELPDEDEINNEPVLEGTTN